MIKALCKKSRDNKGFSLIELIVVIAIIAILALILVPRFGGFTGEAKDAANAATMKTIETAVIALMVNGKISGLNGKIEIPNSPGTIEIDVVGISSDPIKDANIHNDLTALIGDKYECKDGSGFLVTVTDGNVVCSTY